jgi:SAM-dependent methyltransferase
MTQFDGLSQSYEELLRDPLRDLFTSQENAFFHRRKADLIRQFFRRRGVKTEALRYLDIGCGKGEVLGLLRPDFKQSAGCDISAAMMQEISQIETRVQPDPLHIPFGNAEFDLITAACVYHHVPAVSRLALTADIARVLRPGGIFCMIEHNPLNPVTRLIVRRTPVDEDAILLAPRESWKLAADTGLIPIQRSYFLYFPQALYSWFGPVEMLLANLPFGGQYAVFSQKTA